MKPPQFSEPAPVPTGFQRFRLRVRLVRAWKGLGIGCSVAGLACLIWAILDWANILLADWAGFAWLFAVLGLMGVAVGVLLPVPTAALADSIDRRAKLENRLTTSLETTDRSEFAGALHEDANEQFGRIKPSEVFPVSFGRWQGSATVLALLTAGVFLLGNSPLLLPPQERKDREEIKRLGQAVERIAKPLTQDLKAQSMTPSEKRMADELRKLQRDMQRQKLSKEEVSQKANDLAKQTKELLKDRSDLTAENLQKAESALEKLQKAELEKNGQKVDPELLKRMRDSLAKDRELDSEGKPKSTDQKLQELEKSREEMEQQRRQLEKKQQDLKNELSKIAQKLKNRNLSPDQRKALEDLQKKLQEMLKGLEKELAELQSAIQKILQDKEVQELLRKINEHPAMKKLQELAAKLAKEAKLGQQGEIPKITKEQLEELKSQLPELEKQIKEMAKQMQDPKALDEYMEQLRQALENMDKLELDMNVSAGFLSLFGLPIPSMGLPSLGNPEDFMGVDTGQINKDPNGKQGQGNTTLTQIKGARRDSGEEAYIEIKGPTTVGSRSGIKYTKVLPNYRRKAEEAIDKKAIPKQHEKRVKEYFQSLARGK